MLKGYLKKKANLDLLEYLIRSDTFKLNGKQVQLDPIHDNSWMIKRTGEGHLVSAPFNLVGYQSGNNKTLVNNIVQNLKKSHPSHTQILDLWKAGLVAKKWSNVAKTGKEFLENCSTLFLTIASGGILAIGGLKQAYSLVKSGMELISGVREFPSPGFTQGGLSLMRGPTEAHQSFRGVWSLIEDELARNNWQLLYKPTTLLPDELYFVYKRSILPNAITNKLTDMEGVEVFAEAFSQLSFNWLMHDEKSQNDYQLIASFPYYGYSLMEYEHYFFNLTKPFKSIIYESIGRNPMPTPVSKARDIRYGQKNGNQGASNVAIPDGF